MSKIIQKLHEKGKLSDKEAKQALEKLYNKASISKHHELVAASHRVIYATLLLVLGAVMLLLSVFLVPFVLILNESIVLIITFVLGLIFGILFAHVIINLEYLEPKHHIAALLFMPVVGGFSAFLTTALAQRYAEYLNITLQNNMFLLGLMYIVGFLLPYVVTLRQQISSKTI